MMRTLNEQNYIYYRRVDNSIVFSPRRKIERGRHFFLFRWLSYLIFFCWHTRLNIWVCVCSNVRACSRLD